MPRLPKEKFGSVTFVVRGRGAFPLDMLRFDSCVPASGVDVQSMIAPRMYFPAGTQSDGVELVREVKLRRFYPAGGEAAPTVERWASFGWEVREVYP